MISTLASLLICLSAAGSAAAGATGVAASGKRRFLAKSQGEGQQCGASGSDGHFYGDCSSGLECVPPAEGAALGAPSICHKVCGSFGPDGDEVTGTCSNGQTCSGRAATPCREWAGECYLYCAGGPGNEEGQQCGTSGSDGHFYGDCAAGLACVPPAEGDAVGAPSVCHKLCGSFGAGGDQVTGTCSDGQTCSGKAATPCREWAGECYLYCAGEPGNEEGQQCGTSGSDGHFYGDCAARLACVPPAEGDAVGAPSVCHKVCGSFGAGGDKVNGTCSDGQTCSGKAATPCREWAGECYMYCL